MDRVFGPEVRVGLTLPSPARGGGRMDTCTKPRSVRRRGKAQMPLGAGQPVGPSPQQGSSLPALGRCHQEPAVFTLTTLHPLAHPPEHSPQRLGPQVIQRVENGPAAPLGFLGSQVSCMARGPGQATFWGGTGQDRMVNSQGQSRLGGDDHSNTGMACARALGGLQHLHLWGHWLSRVGRVHTDSGSARQ